MSTEVGTENGSANERKIIHQFSVSRCATTFDPLEAVAAATRQAQAEQVVGTLMDPGAQEALCFDYRSEQYGSDVDIDLVVWGTDEALVHLAAGMLHNRYEGHAEPEAIVEEMEVSA